MKRKQRLVKNEKKKSKPSDDSAKTEFVAYVKKWRSVAGLVSGLVTALPLAGFGVPQLLPTWPSGSWGMGIVTTALFIVACYPVFRRVEPARIRRYGVCFIVLGITSGVLYLAAAAMLIFEHAGDRYLQGPIFTAEAREKVKSGEIPNEPPKLLDQFGHLSEHRIWAWHGFVKFAVFMLFLLFFSLTGGGLSLFVLEDFMRSGGQAA